jgi:hypothetical protein
MGNLDEPRFAAVIAACKRCDAKAFEVASYIDRQVTVMLGEPNDDGRWIHECFASSASAAVTRRFRPRTAPVVTANEGSPTSSASRRGSPCRSAVPPAKEPS